MDAVLHPEFPGACYFAVQASPPGAPLRRVQRYERSDAHTTTPPSPAADYRPAPRALLVKLYPDEQAAAADLRTHRALAAARLPGLQWLANGQALLAPASQDTLFLPVCPGQPLGPWVQDDALGRVILGLAGLHAWHQHGFCHGDLHARNVLIEPAQGRDPVQFIDLERVTQRGGPSDTAWQARAVQDTLCVWVLIADLLHLAPGPIEAQLQELEERLGRGVPLDVYGREERLGRAARLLHHGIEQLQRGQTPPPLRQLHRRLDALQPRDDAPSRGGSAQLEQVLFPDLLLLLRGPWARSHARVMVTTIGLLVALLAVLMLVTAWVLSQPPLGYLGRLGALGTLLGCWVTYHARRLLRALQAQIDSVDFEYLAARVQQQQGWMVPIAVALAMGPALADPLLTTRKLREEELGIVLLGIGLRALPLCALLRPAPVLLALWTHADQRARVGQAPARRVRQGLVLRTFHDSIDPGPQVVWGLYAALPLVCVSLWAQMESLGTLGSEPSTLHTLLQGVLPMALLVCWGLPLTYLLLKLQEWGQAETELVHPNRALLLPRPLYLRWSVLAVSVGLLLTSVLWGAPSVAQRLLAQAGPGPAPVKPPTAASGPTLTPPAGLTRAEGPPAQTRDAVATLALAPQAMPQVPEAASGSAAQPPTAAEGRRDARVPSPPRKQREVGDQQTEQGPSEEVPAHLDQELDQSGPKERRKQKREGGRKGRGPRLSAPDSARIGPSVKTQR